VTDKRTLAEAKETFFKEARGQGAVCPCCGCFGKVYKRKIHSGMAAVMVLLYRHQSLGFTHVPTLINATTSPAVAAAIRGDFAKLRYWGLIEEEHVLLNGAKKSSGKWRITGEGARYVEGSISVQKYVWVYNKMPLGFAGERVSIYDALGDKFRYAELMG
jgi:hypothetical protein